MKHEGFTPAPCGCDLRDGAHYRSCPAGLHPEVRLTNENARLAARVKQLEAGHHLANCSDMMDYSATLLARVEKLEKLLYRTATVDHLDDHSDACWCVGRRRHADHQSTCQEIRAALADKS